MNCKAFFLSSLFLFNNGYLVHFRIAILDVFQIFFILCCLYFFIRAIQKNKFSIFTYVLLSIFITLGVMVKINSLITILFLPALFIYQYKKNIFAWDYKLLIKPILKKIGVFLVIFLVLSWSIWYIHIGIGERVSDFHYNYSENYLKIIIDKQTWNPLNTFALIKENLEYSFNYNKTVAKLNYASEDNNGSYPLFWAFGHRTIRYLITTYDDDYKHGKYMFLIINPVIIIFTFLGIFLYFYNLYNSWINNFKDKERYFYLAHCCYFIYICYMLAMLRIDRVMYLYHYFIPLIFISLAFVINLKIFFSAKNYGSVGILKQKYLSLYKFSTTMIWLLV